MVRLKSREILLTIAAVAAGLSFAGEPARAAGPGFLSHQALYELSLVKSRGSNSINSARGRILYNFSGSTCEGYTSEFRQVSELNSGEGKLTLSDLRSTSWEDAAGKSYRFKIDTRMNDADAAPVDGMAERVGDHITVKLKQPVAKTFNLEGKIVFPTEQIQHIIAAARDGKSVLELMVYDGSDNGERVYNTLTRWPVTVTYYDRDAMAKDGEQTPVYAMSFELFEKGVALALMLDYNDFVISGAMVKFDVRDSKPCK